MYFYSNNNVVKKENKYIKNGRVDNVPLFIDYLKNSLESALLKKKYIFILDNLLNNSDLFVYNYVFKSIGILDYKIIHDIDLIKYMINEENIVICNWSSTITYSYLNNSEIITNPLNINIINNLDKKYILIIGDEPLSKNINKPIYKMENSDKVIFNCL